MKSRGGLFFRLFKKERSLFIAWEGPGGGGEDLRLNKVKFRRFSFSLRKHPFLLALRRWGSFARNVPSLQANFPLKWSPTEVIPPNIRDPPLMSSFPKQIWVVPWILPKFSVTPAFWVLSYLTDPPFCSSKNQVIPAPPPPPPQAVNNDRFLILRTAPHYLNAWNRLLSTRKVTLWRRSEVRLCPQATNISPNSNGRATQFMWVPHRVKTTDSDCEFPCQLLQEPPGP